jgi:hypothetical protein
MAGFLHWLAPQYDPVRTRLPSELAELRQRATADGQHARTPGIVADLALGLRYFLDFAVGIGAISDTDRGELWRRGWAALNLAGAAHAAQIATAEPAGQFLRLLQAAVSSGCAHIADERGEAPAEPQRWGWRLDGNVNRPLGKCVGWLVDGEVYLEPDASYAVVQLLARDKNEMLAVGDLTLRRRLNEKGLLATTDKERGKLTVRKTLQGSRREVLHIVWTEASVTASEAAAGNGPETNVPNGEEGPKPRVENGHVNGKPAQHLAPSGTPGQQPATADSELGRLGRLERGEKGAAKENCSEQQGQSWGDRQ